jgi:hypothetical protein
MKVKVQKKVWICGKRVEEQIKEELWFHTWPTKKEYNSGSGSDGVRATITVIAEWKDKPKKKRKKK